MYLHLTNLKRILLRKNIIIKRAKNLILRDLTKQS